MDRLGRAGTTTLALCGLLLCGNYIELALLWVIVADCCREGKWLLGRILGDEKKELGREG